MIDKKLKEELLGLDHLRGYRQSPREAEYQDWLDDLWSEGQARGYRVEVDGTLVQFWEEVDGEERLVDEFEFESWRDRPEWYRG